VSVIQRAPCCICNVFVFVYVVCGVCKVVAAGLQCDWSAIPGLQVQGMKLH
jgi:hypothetical protein